jgi:hypothetical protein
MDLVLCRNLEDIFICRQCSECDKESSGSDFEVVDTEAPRKLRHNKEAEKPLCPLTPKVSGCHIYYACVKYIWLNRYLRSSALVLSGNI